MKRTLSLLAGLAALTACEEPVVCTEIAMTSVTVQLSDPTGAPILGANLQYTVEDEATRFDCFEWDDGWYGCGTEQAGLITVYAEADGYLPGEGSAVVEADECHVQGEEILLTLEQETACPADVISYAVAVTVVDETGEPVVDAEVTWSLPNAELAPQPCEGWDGVYFCAEGHSGLIEVWADHEGKFASALVEVDADECGPITEEVELVLDTCG